MDWGRLDCLWKIVLFLSAAELWLCWHPYTSKFLRLNYILDVLRVSERSAIFFLFLGELFF